MRLWCKCVNFFGVSAMNFFNPKNIGASCVMHNSICFITCFVLILINKIGFSLLELAMSIHPRPLVFRK